MIRILAAILAVTLLARMAQGGTGRPLNVLFIAVDDLRPELGCYGTPVVNTPNIDALAERGLRFNRAYCQQAICGPSRTSLMTGLRPDTSGAVHNDVYFRKTVPDVVTLPQQFIAHGYESIYTGKIYHTWMRDEEKSWSSKAVFPKAGPAPVGGYALPENQALVKRRQEDVKKQYPGDKVGGLACGPATEAADVPDNAYADGRTADSAVATLKQIKDKPFFLAVGFHKPHLPFVAPKRYWDLYDPAEIPLAENGSAPEGGAAMGLHSSFELRTRVGIPKSGPIDDKLARHLLHGYLACVSYIDAQVGKVLAELDRLGLRDNTVVILWGDHGWHLGEMGVWGKATNYEIAARTPLIISAPGMKARGKATGALVELIDMYPTLCDLAGVPVPRHVEGSSFAPLLNDPNRPWKTAAFSQFPCPALREWAALPLSEAMRRTFFGPLITEKEQLIADELPGEWSRDKFEKHVMGYTMRTDRYRLVRWVDVRSPKKALAVELFDHQTDPHETRNIAAENADVVKELSAKMTAGWKAARPGSTVNAMPTGRREPIGRATSLLAE